MLSVNQPSRKKNPFFTKKPDIDIYNEKHETNAFYVLVSEQKRRAALTEDYKTRLVESWVSNQLWSFVQL